MRDKEKLCRELERNLGATSDTTKHAYTMDLLKEHKIPLDVSSEYLNLRNPLITASDFLLYCVSEKFDKINLSDYFVKAEIDSYQKMQYELSNLIFPLQFKMIQVGNSENRQWIGSISTKKLMQLRDARAILYNANTQRTLQHINRRGNEYYKISLNQSAVNAISQLMNDGNYMPNTITLNMPEDAVYDYDEETSTLTINNNDNGDFHFDILDGYHRYIAISTLYQQDPEFDYPMELRIVLMDENKARQFIWQEDQKTKMRKIDSDSLNQENIGNMVVDRLRRDASFDMASAIGRNDSLINSAELAWAINGFYKTKNITKSNTPKMLIKISNEIKEGVNATLKVFPELIEQKWNKQQLCLLIFIICYGSELREYFGGQKDCKVVYAKVLDWLLNDPIGKKLFKRYTFNYSDITRLKKKIIEVAG